MKPLRAPHNVSFLAEPHTAFVSAYIVQFLQPLRYTDENQSSVFRYATVDTTEMSLVVTSRPLTCSDLSWPTVGTKFSDCGSNYETAMLSGTFHQLEINPNNYKIDVGFNETLVSQTTPFTDWEGVACETRSSCAGKDRATQPGAEPQWRLIHLLEL